MLSVTALGLLLAQQRTLAVLLEAARALRGLHPSMSLVQVGCPVLGQALLVIWGHGYYGPPWCP